MSLVKLSNVCSHLQNCSKGRLGLTSIPSTKLLLSLSLALQNAGFISTVTRGGPHPPQLLTATALPHATDEAALDPEHPDSAIITQANVASRRLWLGLKYWKGEPVLSRMSMVSKPTQRIWLGSKDMEKVVLGREARYVKGLTRTGESLFVSTDRGIMEARECVERQIGGLALCRAY